MKVVVADTSVLINFLRIDRMDLLAALPEQIIVTDHVGVEISSDYAEQRERFDQAMLVRIVVEEAVVDPVEVEFFLRLGASCSLNCSLSEAA